MPRINNSNVLDSNIKALNAFVRDLRDSRINSVDNPISFDLDVIQALFIKKFGIKSILLLIFLLSS